MHLYIHIWKLTEETTNPKLKERVEEERCYDNAIQ